MSMVDVDVDGRQCSARATSLARVIDCSVEYGQGLESGEWYVLNNEWTGTEGPFDLFKGLL